MAKKLTEAVNVPGAELIGTAKGYDLFDIRTYAAAQQFVMENTTHPAGAAYTQNEATFNQNINENQHLYFFVENETNHVYAGVVKGGNSHSDITIKGINHDFTIHVNFLFEVIPLNQQKIFPFFLIPGIIVDDAVGNLIIRDEELHAVLPQLTRDETIDLDLNAMPNIGKVASKAFAYHMHINNLTLGENIQVLLGIILTDVDHVKITWTEKPAGWIPSWSHGYEDKIEYLQAEEIARIQQQKEHDAELARQRAAEAAAEAERQRLQLERQRIEREKQEVISKIRYKKEGKAITILGLKISASGKIIIPEMIDDLPVTKISAFAFYRLENVDSITLPLTIREIGQGAFAFTRLENIIMLPSKCIIGKNAFYGSNVRYRVLGEAHK